MKRDGHTHTEYCPHGSGEPVELLIQKAIQQGFKQYSITEHMPLPEGLVQFGSPDVVWQTAAMAMQDIDHYFQAMQRLQKKYAADIQLEIGFEVDYLPGYEDWTRDFLNEYGPLLSDGVLSVHFVAGAGGLRGVDYDAKEWREGVVTPLGSYQAAQKRYFETVRASLLADLGPFKPTRLGHITLCEKFQQEFTDTTRDAATNQLLETLLDEIQAAGYELDLNTAGFDKSAYRQSYPSTDILLLAQARKIPLVYGSDSHGLADIGRHYDWAQTWL